LIYKAVEKKELFHLLTGIHSLAGTQKYLPNMFIKSSERYYNIKTAV